MKSSLETRLFLAAESCLETADSSSLGLYSPARSRLVVAQSDWRDDGPMSLSDIGVVGLQKDWFSAVSKESSRPVVQMGGESDETCPAFKPVDVSAGLYSTVLTTTPYE